MTAKKIDAMQAGQEMNKLVLVEVLGAKYFREREAPSGYIVVGAYWLGEDYYFGHCSMFSVFSPSIPPYSTDIAAAMRVFQHLRQSGRWCCLVIESDHHYVWGVHLTPAGDSDHLPIIHSGSCESLPLAICRAALKASLEAK